MTCAGRSSTTRTASLKVLAKTHGRNVKWADAAVRVASNLPAYAALQQNVIDVTRAHTAALLNKIDGRKTIPKGFVLHTAGADITTAKMGLWQRVLDTLIDPNLIALMLSLGVLGIVIELWHPGLIFPAPSASSASRSRSTGSTCSRSAGRA